VWAIESVVQHPVVALTYTPFLVDLKHITHTYIADRRYS